MDETRNDHQVLDVRELMANFPWDEVAEPPAGSGAMAHTDGQPMTEAEVEQWWTERLRARQQS